MNGTENVVESGLPRFLGIRAVEVFTGWSKSSILRRVQKGVFPAPALREGNSVKWDYGSLLVWREEAMKAGKAQQELIEEEQRERQRKRELERERANEAEQRERAKLEAATT
jgi:predicted DNA-binding transcriptional regulator AlpA